MARAWKLAEEGRGAGARRESGPSIARLWIGIALAPAAWTIAELAGYALVARGCAAGPHGTVGVLRPDVVMVVVTVAAALGAVGGLYVAWSSWRSVEAGRPVSDRRTEVTSEPWAQGTAPDWGRSRFMARAGLLSSALFLGGIVLFGIPPVLVNTCNAVR
jgi:hypothetical protein